VLSVSPVSKNRRFEFHKRSQLFVRTHNEALSVIAVRVRNPDCSPVGINRCDAAPTPTGFRFLESKSGRGKQEKADRSLRLESGENTPLSIGFPRSDVFRYEGKKPLRSINWAKMKRWQ
jgi:hypothetical protein